MYLYHLTVQPPTHIPCAAAGCFSGNRRQELVVARGPSRIELLRLDGEMGRLVSVAQTPLFCAIRSMVAFRLPGDERDYLVVGTDAGRLAILAFDEGRQRWVRLHLETFGRSGVRRTVPGEYVAADPQGRAIMVAAVERQKFVYIMNRDPSTAKPTISSPLEAHKSNIILYSLVGIDVGYENPLFAALETEMVTGEDTIEGKGSKAEERPHKTLTYYELDLGLNHVTRKWSEAVTDSANLLVAVPGGEEGPGGVLVCGEGCISWHRQGKPAISIDLPQRRDVLAVHPKRRALVSSAALVRAKGLFFFLLHTEEGDLLKLTVGRGTDPDASTEVSMEGEERDVLKVHYFDSVPVATILAVFKSGFLFVASEWANHQLYQIQALGPDAYQIPSTESIIPHGLRNLVLVEESVNQGELTDARVMNLDEEETSPQIYALQGRAAHSSFSILRQGLQVSEVASSELPSPPRNLWTLKRNLTDEEDLYMVVAFEQSTVVLRVGETVEEASDTAFLTNNTTLGVVQLADNSYAQVHPRGVRQIRPDGRVNEWRAPTTSLVKRCATNARQVILSLDSRTIIYLECDGTGTLQEYKPTTATSLPEEILSMALGPVPEGRQRSRFLAVGTADSTLRILSCDPDDRLEPLSVQALAARPESLLMTALPVESSEEAAILAAGSSTATVLILDVGLQNGVHVRLRIDGTTGVMGDARTRFLGTHPVHLGRALIDGSNHDAILALSSRPWLIHTFQGRTRTIPLAYPSLTAAVPFSSPQCPFGVAVVMERSLRILAFENLADCFVRHPISLDHTPRRIAYHPTLRLFALVESDHRGYSVQQRRNIVTGWCANTISPSGGEEAKNEGSDGLIEKETSTSSRKGKQRTKGADAMSEIRAELDQTTWTHLSYKGKWSSSIRLVSPFKGCSTAVVSLEENEAALCTTFVTFYERPSEVFLAVGISRDMSVCPRGASSSAILLYAVDPRTGTLSLLHRTALDGIPSALAAFGGRLLAGVGNALRLYDLGRKQLLRKCEARLPTFALSLQTQGWRIVVGDAHDAVLIFHYHAEENHLQLAADDTQLRPVTALCMLDYDTAAGGDRLGNFFVDRLPGAVAEELEREILCGVMATKRGHLFGAPFKLDRVAEFHLGDTITSLSKTTLMPGSRELLLYTTISGAIGLFLPFTSREEALLLQNMEQFMRQEDCLSLVGRDHLSFRSAYVPVKSVIDGDLCELYLALPGDRKHHVATGLDRTPADLLKKLDDLRITAGV